MLWILLACTVGPSEHATDGSPSAVEAAAMSETQDIAGRLAGKARELEAASQQARTRLEAGGDPIPELNNLERLMTEIEEMETALQRAQTDRIRRIREQAQSTAKTTE